MVGGAHLFVEELLSVAEDVGVEAIVLSLILAPLATELPEKVNSFFWVRDGKDSLALGNITGAMVFQSMIPVGIGLLFTDWDLSGNAAALRRARAGGRRDRLLGASPPATASDARRCSPGLRSTRRSSPSWPCPYPPGFRAQEGAEGLEHHLVVRLGCDLGEDPATLPSASMTTVDRFTPMDFLP